MAGSPRRGALAELLESTDLPAGVVDVVTGLGAEAGEALVAHAGVAKIAFTGSTATGKHVRGAAETLKRGGAGASSTNPAAARRNPVVRSSLVESSGGADAGGPGAAPRSV